MNTKSQTLNFCWHFRHFQVSHNYLQFSCLLFFYFAAIQFLSRTLAGQGPAGLSSLLASLGNGGSLNIADAFTGLNLEVAPFRHDFEMLGETTLLHCNMYTHLGVKQKQDI